MGFLSLWFAAAVAAGKLVLRAVLEMRVCKARAGGGQFLLNIQSDVQYTVSDLCI